MKKFSSFMLIFLLILSSTITGIALSQQQNFNNTGLFLSDDEWPMMGHDLQRTGYTPERGPTSDDVLWFFEMEHNDGSRGGPSVADGRVYCGSGENDGCLYCLDSLTGEKIWSFDTDNDIWTVPVVDGDYVFFGTGDGESGKCLYCLYKQSGLLKWEVQLDRPIYENILVVDGLVIVSAVEHLYALSSETGDVIWDYLAPGGDSNLFRDMAYSKGNIFVGSRDNNMYCFNCSTGEIVWTFETEESIMNHPVVTEGRVVFGSFDDNLYCLNETTGELIWSLRLDGIAYGCAVAHGCAYVSLLDTRVVCVRLRDAALLWENYVGGIFGPFTPVVADDKVYVPGEISRNLFCLDAFSGELIWRFPTVGYCFSPLCVADGCLFAVNDDGFLYCISDDAQLVVDEIHGGLGFVSAQVTNKGDSIIEDISCQIDINGGYLAGKLQMSRQIDSLDPGESKVLFCGPFIGIGALEVTARANSAIRHATGTIFLVVPNLK